MPLLSVSNIRHTDVKYGSFFKKKEKNSSNGSKKSKPLISFKKKIDGCCVWACGPSLLPYVCSSRDSSAVSHTVCSGADTCTCTDTSPPLGLGWAQRGGIGSNILSPISHYVSNLHPHPPPRTSWPGCEGKTPIPRPPISAHSNLQNGPA